MSSQSEDRWVCEKSKSVTVRIHISSVGGFKVLVNCRRFVPEEGAAAALVEEYFGESDFDAKRC